MASFVREDRVKGGERKRKYRREGFLSGAKIGTGDRVTKVCGGES